MKKLKGISAVFILAVLFQSTLSVAEVRYIRGQTVANSQGDPVTDGDTVRVAVPGEGTLKIRMMSIDTPELHMTVPGQRGYVGQQPWGEQAATYLAQLIPVGTPVILEDRGTDRYGRTLGRLYREVDNADVNYLMTLSGWATPYIYCEEHGCSPGDFEEENVQAYLEACDFARSQGLGVFDPSNPLTEMPFEFRLRVQRRHPEKYVGDYYTKKLYAPTQYDQVDLCRRVFFSSESLAYTMGFQY